MPKPRLLYPTREAWLNAALLLLSREFKEEFGKPVPKALRVSCGFPSRNALGNKKRRVGECWSDKASDGKVFEIFISPLLSKPIEVLDTTLHEMIHATVGLECGHKGEFVRVWKRMGFVGKPTADEAGPELITALKPLAVKLGPYPHDRLNRMTNGKKPDKCRLVKAECEECGYVIRTTRKWIDEAGLPTCVCGGDFVESE